MPMQDMSTILNNAVAVGPGNSFNLFIPYSAFTFVKRVNGVFTALTVNFEGSLDNNVWYQIGTDATVGNGATFVVDRASRYIRANVATFTGGTNVSVDVLPMGSE